MSEIQMNLRFFSLKDEEETIERLEPYVEFVEKKKGTWKGYVKDGRILPWFLAELENKLFTGNIRIPDGRTV